MSLVGDAVATIRNVVLMQAKLEGIEKQVEKLGNDQAGFREAMIALRERVVRVETIIEEARAAGRGRRALPED